MKITVIYPVHLSLVLHVNIMPQRGTLRDIAVEFKDLWKYQSPFGRVEEFDLSLFEQLIEVSFFFSHARPFLNAVILRKLICYCATLLRRKLQAKLMLFVLPSQRNNIELQSCALIMVVVIRAAFTVRLDAAEQLHDKLHNDRST